MSRAELEIIKLKENESTAWEQRKRSTLGSGFGNVGAVQEDEEEDDADHKPYDEADQITKLYR